MEFCEDHKMVDKCQTAFLIDKFKEKCNIIAIGTKEKTVAEFSF